MKSYIQVYDRIKAIANGHSQINSFGEGDTWEIATSGTTNYPMFWAVTQGSEIKRGEIGYKFQFIIMDLVQTGEGNERDVLSDTHQIMADVLAELKMGAYADIDLKFSDTFSLASFTEKFDDMVSGWTCDLTIWTPFNWNSCNIPGTFTGGGVLQADNGTPLEID
jgi:hypothetical protein